MDERTVMPVTEEKQITETDEQKLARLATEINTIKVQVQSVVQNATLEIGRRLTQAKAAVPYGCWGQWLREKVDYSERTAQMLISTYERFGQGQQNLFGKVADPELVAQLSRSQMFALMSIKNEDDCVAFMEEHKEDLPDMSKRELEQAIKDRDQARKDLEAWRTQCDTLTDTAQKATSRAEKLKAELVQLKADTAAGSDELEKIKAKNEDLMKEVGLWTKRLNDEHNELLTVTDNLKMAQRQLEEERIKNEKQIKDLQENGATSENEELKRLQAEIAISAGKIKQLEQQLEAAEKAQPVADREKTQEEKDFARHFENCKAEFTQLLNSMGAISENQDRYREAARKMLGIMSQLIG